MPNPNHSQVGPQPPASPQKPAVLTGAKILIGAFAFCTLGLVGCAGSSVAASDDVASVTTGAAEDAAPAAPTDSSEDSPEAGDIGSLENPYPFGTEHTRDPGFLGTGWTVSIDEVRVIEDSKTSMPETEGTCLAVIGTATLDSLDNNELASNGFSFPPIKLVAEGKETELDTLGCEIEPLKDEGIVWVLDSELTPGTTITWYQIFRPETDRSYDFVAVENDVYADN